MEIPAYQILAELGRGEVAVVYRALRRADRRIVALKVVPLREFTDEREREALRERLFRETRSAAVLAHRFIAAVYEVGQQGDSIYVAMEYVNGSTLAQLLAAQPRPKREYVSAIVRSVATALDYAHNRGVIHRDIKPSNIMIGEGGAVKIMDFGISRISPPTGTHDYFRIGTPSYAPLEQLQGRPVDGRADQYSLAVVAYEMFTGEQPSPIALLNAVGYMRVRDLGERIGNALSRALAPRPEMRFRTCTEFVDELEGVRNPARPR